MSIPDLSDLLDRALGRLLWQYRNRSTETNVEKLVRVAVGQVEPLRDNLVALIEERTIETAVGAQLDQWGSVLALPRGGRDDDSYRIALRARLAVYLSNGTAEQIITIVRLLVGDVVVEVRDRYPALFSVQYERETPTTDSERRVLVDQLEAAAAAGVAVELVEAPDIFFGFFGDPDALGFDEGELSYKLTP
jgi:hypothetical protein